MCQITLSLPDEALSLLNLTPEQMGAELRMAAAVKLFEMGRLSSGAAAALAGVPRVVFLSNLGDYGVETFRLTEDEVARETRVRPLIERNPLTEEDVMADIRWASGKRPAQ